MTIGGRKLGGRIAVGRRRDEARLHDRALGVGIPADQQVRGRSLVSARTGVQEASRPDVPYSAFRAADDLVTLAVRREPVVAVGDDLGDRDRLRLLLVEDRDPVGELFFSRRIAGHHDAIDVSPGDDRGLNHLLREQPFTGRPFTLGLRDRLLHRFGELFVRVLPQLLFVRRLDLPDFRSERRLARLDLVNLLVVRLRFRAGHQRIRRLDVAEEGRRQAVIVSLWNRIELVIVAARAMDCEPQHAPSGRGNQIVEVFVPPFRVVFLAEGHPRTRAEEPGGDQRVIGPGIELVAGELFLQKDVVRLVLIERANHIVPITPGVGTVVVLLEAARVRVARHVQPMPPPPLAVMRRGEQPIDQPFPGIRRGIGEKRGGFSGAGR